MQLQVNGWIKFICRIGVALIGLSGCGKPQDTNQPPDEPGALPSSYLAGKATVVDSSNEAFMHPFPILDDDQERAFLRGRALFRDIWVVAPASTSTRDGLGPLFNARACEACHIRDGRGVAPASDKPLVSMFVRLSIGTDSQTHAPIPEPVYGLQLEPRAIPGVKNEGQAYLKYEEVHGAYGDGEPYTLLRPRLELAELNYGPMHPDAQASVRIARQVIGLALLEAVPESVITAYADPDDKNGDGIAGRPNWVWDFTEQTYALGRFGWKATQPSVRQQTAAAFLLDIGMTSSMFPNETCTETQLECLASPSGGEPELLESFLDDVTFYTRTLAVPAQRDSEDPAVVQGKSTFVAIGCAQCHRPSLRTGDLPEFPELADQIFYPYTDLLLHDMGDDLDDGRPDFLATGRQWRTPPLWGIGLSSTVSGGLFLLNDGRARSFEEAILWHGGEAQQAKESFRTLPKASRDALVKFLSTL